MTDSKLNITARDIGVNEILNHLKKIYQQIDDLGVRTAVLDDVNSDVLRKTNDIDLVVSSTRKAVRVFEKHGFFIQMRPVKRNKLKGLPIPKFRACIGKSGKLLTIDLIEVNSKTSNQLETLFSSEVHHPEIGFRVGRPSTRAAWKAYKYFAVGNIGKVRQLIRLQKEWRRLNKIEEIEAFKVIKSLPAGGNVLIFLERLMIVSGEVGFCELLDDARNTEGYREKENNRVVLAGKLITDKKTALRLVVIALFKKWFWRYRVSSFPVIAFVGNDGAGKSSTSLELASGSLSKIDPLIVSMKRKDPIFLTLKKARNRLSKILNKKASSTSTIRNITIVRLAFWLKELLDYVDRLFRYILSMLWARAGLGPVFMDRYVTDRLRGEYSRDHWQLHPLEQFFPMPDGFAFFDVSAEVSMQRKPEDGHALSVLFEKRNNYIRLMSEIDRVKTIDGLTTQENVFKEAEQYVLSLCHEMQKAKIVQGLRRWRRAKWQPR